jgi:hypothetical protein
VVHEALEGRAEPPGREAAQAARVEERLPFRGRVEARGRRHAAAVASAVHPRVEQAQPEELGPAAVDGLGHDQPVARHARRLVEHGRGLRAVVQDEQEQGGIEGAVGEGQAGAVVDDVGNAYLVKRADVDTADEAADRAEASGDEPLAGAEIEHAAADDPGRHVARLAARVASDERLDRRPHRSRIDSRRRRASGASFIVQSA